MYVYCIWCAEAYNVRINLSGIVGMVSFNRERIPGEIKHLGAITCGARMIRRPYHAGCVTSGGHDVCRTFQLGGYVRMDNLYR